MLSSSYYFNTANSTASCSSAIAVVSCSNVISCSAALSTTGVVTIGVTRIVIGVSLNSNNYLTAILTHNSSGAIAVICLRIVRGDSCVLATGIVTGCITIVILVEGVLHRCYKLIITNLAKKCGSAIAVINFGSMSDFSGEVTTVVTICITGVIELVNLSLYYNSSTTNVSTVNRSCAKTVIGLSSMTREFGNSSVVVTAGVVTGCVAAVVGVAVSISSRNYNTVTLCAVYWRHTVTVIRKSSVNSISIAFFTSVVVTLGVAAIVIYVTKLCINYDSIANLTLNSGQAVTVISCGNMVFKLRCALGVRASLVVTSDIAIIVISMNGLSSYKNIAAEYALGSGETEVIVSLGSMDRKFCSYIVTIIIVTISILTRIAECVFLSINDDLVTRRTLGSNGTIGAVLDVINVRSNSLVLTSCYITCRITDTKELMCLVLLYKKLAAYSTKNVSVSTIGLTGLRIDSRNLSRICVLGFSYLSTVVMITGCITGAAVDMIGSRLCNIAAYFTDLFSCAVAVLIICVSCELFDITNVYTTYVVTGTVGASIVIYVILSSLDHSSETSGADLCSFAIAILFVITFNKLACLCFVCTILNVTDTVFIVANCIVGVTSLSSNSYVAALCTELSSSAIAVLYPSVRFKILKLLSVYTVRIVTEEVVTKVVEVVIILSLYKCKVTNGTILSISTKISVLVSGVANKETLVDLALTALIITHHVFVEALESRSMVSLCSDCNITANLTENLCCTVAVIIFGSVRLGSGLSEIVTACVVTRSVAALVLIYVNKNCLELFAAYITELSCCTVEVIILVYMVDKIAINKFIFTEVTDSVCIVANFIGSMSLSGRDCDIAAKLTENLGSTVAVILEGSMILGSDVSEVSTTFVVTGSVAALVLINVCDSFDKYLVTYITDLSSGTIEVIAALDHVVAVPNTNVNVVYEIAFNKFIITEVTDSVCIVANFVGSMSLSSLNNCITALRAKLSSCTKVITGSKFIVRSIISYECTALVITSSITVVSIDVSISTLEHESTAVHTKYILSTVIYEELLVESRIKLFNRSLVKVTVIFVTGSVAAIVGVDVLFSLYKNYATVYAKDRSSAVAVILVLNVNDSSHVTADITLCIANALLISVSGSCLSNLTADTANCICITVIIVSLRSMTYKKIGDIYKTAVVVTDTVFIPTLEIEGMLLSSGSDLTANAAESGSSTIVIYINRSMNNEVILGKLITASVDVTNAVSIVAVIIGSVLTCFLNKLGTSDTEAFLRADAEVCIRNMICSCLELYKTSVVVTEAISIIAIKIKSVCLSSSCNVVTNLTVSGSGAVLVACLRSVSLKITVGNLISASLDVTDTVCIIAIEIKGVCKCFLKKFRTNYAEAILCTDAIISIRSMLSSCLEFYKTAVVITNTVCIIAIKVEHVRLRTCSNNTAILTVCRSSTIVIYSTGYMSSKLALGKLVATALIVTNAIFIVAVEVIGVLAGFLKKHRTNCTVAFFGANELVIIRNMTNSLELYKTAVVITNAVFIVAIKVKYVSLSSCGYTAANTAKCLGCAIVINVSRLMSLKLAGSKLVAATVYITNAVFIIAVEVICMLICALKEKITNGTVALFRANQLIFISNVISSKICKCNITSGVVTEAVFICAIEVRSMTLKSSDYYITAKLAKSINSTVKAVSGLVKNHSGGSANVTVRIAGIICIINVLSSRNYLNAAYIAVNSCCAIVVICVGMIYPIRISYFTSCTSLRSTIVGEVMVSLCRNNDVIAYCTTSFLSTVSLGCVLVAGSLSYVITLRVVTGCIVASCELVLSVRNRQLAAVYALMSGCTIKVKLGVVILVNGFSDIFTTVVVTVNITSVVKIMHKSLDSYLAANGTENLCLTVVIKESIALFVGSMISCSSKFCFATVIITDTIFIIAIIIEYVLNSRSNNCVTDLAKNGSCAIAVILSGNVRIRSTLDSIGTALIITHLVAVTVPSVLKSLDSYLTANGTENLCLAVVVSKAFALFVGSMLYEECLVRIFRIINVIASLVVTDIICISAIGIICMSNCFNSYLLTLAANLCSSAIVIIRSKIIVRSIISCSTANITLVVTVVGPSMSYSRNNCITAKSAENRSFAVVVISGLIMRRNSVVLTTLVLTSCITNSCKSLFIRAGEIVLLSGNDLCTALFVSADYGSGAVTVIAGINVRNHVSGSLAAFSLAYRRARIFVKMCSFSRSKLVGTYTNSSSHAVAVVCYASDGLDESLSAVILENGNDLMSLTI